MKLGGSLVTDKERPGRARRDEIRRLAREAARAWPELEERLVVGHGSGSFGHAAADRHGIGRGVLDASRLPGVVETQARAAELHGMMLEALREAGLPAFSLPPSGAGVAEGGEIREYAVAPLVAALETGLVPVVHGDVLADRRWGAAIASTEDVFRALLSRLPEEGWAVRRVLWLGVTEGVHDRAGETVPRITPATVDDLKEALGGSAGIDVTGGMAHRVETALALTELGVTSRILDGRRPGLLERALRGEPVPGTLVSAGDETGTA